MAKKSRRVRRKGAQPRLSDAQLIQPTQEAVEVKPLKKETVKQPAEQPEAADFGTEYHYVASDLKRIGLLATVMLGGLLVLSLIL